MLNSLKPFQDTAADPDSRGIIAFKLRIFILQAFQLAHQIIVFFIRNLGLV